MIRVMNQTRFEGAVRYGPSALLQNGDKDAQESLKRRERRFEALRPVLRVLDPDPGKMKSGEPSGSTISPRADLCYLLFSRQLSTPRARQVQLKRGDPGPLPVG